MLRSLRIFPAFLPRESSLGRTEDSRRTSEARNRNLRNNGCEIHGEASKATFADMAHIPEKPYDDPSFRRFLCCSHGHVSVALRLRDVLASSATTDSFCCDEESDCRVDSAAGLGSVPL